ncbi:MAG TPA: hypothetical protein VEA60_14800 [Allosphingosinicella sp.]|nr:hypothetical protein [Allosphingosinicella sp.]
MGWLDWLNVAGSVLDIVSEVAGLLGDDEKEGGQPSYILGDLEWIPINGKIYAVNNDPSNDVGLLYLVQNLNGTSQSTLSTAVTIAANGGWSEETADLTQFLGGTVNLNGVPPAGADTPGRLFSFVMRTFSAATAINILGGVQGRFNKTDTGWSFTLATTGPKLNSFKATVADPAGNSGSVEATFSKAQVGADEVTVALPPGLDLSTFVASMEVELTVDASEVRRFFEKGRQGRPASEMPEEVRARRRRP